MQTGPDGLGGLHVRGGSSDQNMILYDGVKVYNPNHTLGLFSIFNSHIIKSANLVKDGFSAKYGGRLSSILDVRMKEGNMKKYEVSGGVGLIFSRLSVEGPIKKDKASFIGFGTFSTNDRPARDGRNPSTGATIKIAAKTVVKFKPGKALAEAVNK